jgi:hypothetical protein
MSKTSVANRRGTVAQETADILLDQAEKEIEKSAIREKTRKIRNSFYNSEYRELLSRG